MKSNLTDLGNHQELYCPLCEKNHPLELREHSTSSLVSNEVVNHLETVYYCSINDAEFAMGKYIDINLLRARDAYRKTHQLLTSSEIKEIRSKINVTQKEFAFLLGLGEVTIVRYETTHIQDKNYDDMIRRADVDYAFLMQKLEDSKARFSENKYSEIKATLRNRNHHQFVEDYKMLFLKRYFEYEEKTELSGFSDLDSQKACAMVAYFAKQISGLAKVKLNKMMWYSDALSFLKYGHSISGLIYQHLRYGAVPVGAEELIRFAPVEIEEMELEDGHSICLISFSEQSNYNQIMESLTHNEKELLSQVTFRLSQFSAPELSEMMHKERAYVETKPYSPIPFSLADPLLAFSTINER